MQQDGYRCDAARRFIPALVLTGALIVSACAGDTAAPAFREVPGGDPRQGKQAIQQYGCGACHIIPGVAGARGQVGPPLTGFASRSFVAGRVPNTQENLRRWIENPQAVEPGTAMPYLGVTEAEARDIAAYLYTLK